MASKLEFIKWDWARYGLNIPAIDREHEILVGLMGTVHALHEAQAGSAALGAALGDLVAYARRHFATEEAFMARIGYAELTGHARLHQQILERARAFAAQFERSGVLPPEFFDFLGVWLNGHIGGLDAQYAAFAAEGSPPRAATR
jgi:hemerythrin-like metal-binding protein